jgi:hypothetical protein
VETRSGKAKVKPEVGFYWHFWAFCGTFKIEHPKTILNQKTILKQKSILILKQKSILKQKNKCMAAFDRRGGVTAARGLFQVGALFGGGPRPRFWAPRPAVR